VRKGVKTVPLFNAKIVLVGPAPGKPCTITGAYQRVSDDQRAATDGHVKKFYEQLYAGRLRRSNLVRAIAELQQKEGVHE
jgi:hypothetical protein